MTKSKLPSFLDFLSKEKKKELYPALRTVFGSHSIEKKELYPALKTVFDSHSAEKKKINEGTAKEDIADNLIINRKLHAENALPESAHITSYTRDSKPLNNHLHMKYAKKLGKEGEDKIGRAKNSEDSYESHKNGLDEILHKASTKQDMHVYTGLRESPHHYFEGKDKPIKIHLPAYTSTSSRHKDAASFSELDTENQIVTYINLEIVMRPLKKRFNLLHTC